MELQQLEERMEHLAASEDPLSSDVVILHGDQYKWIFDVGASEEAYRRIASCQGKKKVVLSHFHGDHTTNLRRVDCEQIYCGAYTAEKLGCGTAVEAPLFIQDGLKLCVFPLPSSHAKGCLGLEVNDHVAFLGDALYTTKRRGQYVYVSNTLQQTIQTIRGLKAEYVCVSHRSPFVLRKEAVLLWLEGIYARRNPQEAYIIVES